MTPRAVGAVLLAAGGSTRLGRPKQLVVLEGAPLVVRAARAAREAGASPVVVVLGAEAARVREALAHEPVEVVENAAWREGMGASIACGVHRLLDLAPDIDAALVALVDQPRVDASALRRLLDAGAADGPDGLAAADYAGTVGVPALFGRAHLHALGRLAPASGAGPLLRAAGSLVRQVPMPEAELDVDTAEDLARLET